MKKLLLGLLLFSSLAVIGKPVTELLNIPYPIIYSDDIGMNAYSDGHRVLIGNELQKFINDEEQLGLVILHEVFHNVLKHGEQRTKELKEFCKNIPDIDTCISIYDQAHYAKQQEREREADYLSFVQAKKIGYSSDVCFVFIKFRKYMGENSPYSTHPQLSERFQNCLDVFAREG